MVPKFDKVSRRSCPVVVVVFLLLLLNPSVMWAQGTPTVDQEGVGTTGQCNPAARADQYAKYVQLDYGLMVLCAATLVLAQYTRSFQKSFMSFGAGHVWPLIFGLLLSIALPLLFVRWGEDRGFLGLFCVNLEINEQHPFHIIQFPLLFLGCYMLLALGCYYIHRYFVRHRKAKARAQGGGQ